MESAVADALIGQTLDQRYLVRSRIAHGGMATVYLAIDTRLDREVALKVMHAELARDTGFVNRFIGEAKSVARLSHPNIVAVFDQGSDGHYPYLAMEYVPGRTLRALLAERGWFPYPDALAIMDPVLSGLAAAHHAGIVHRDVKPENVLLAADGRVKVVDFGLARAQAAATRHTQAGQIIGTVAYIAPEQVTGGATDFRTDVYAAGVMLFELLTGRQPFTGESPLAVAYAHVNSTVPPPSVFVSGLPPALDDLVRAATSRDPRLRPSSAEEFLRAARAATGGDTQITGSGQADTFDAPAPAAPAPVYSHTMVVDPAAFGEQYAPAAGAFEGHHHPEPFLGRWLFSRRLGGIVAAAVIVAAAGIGAWWMLAGRYTSMPHVDGMSEARAEAALRADGFQPSVGRTAIDNSVPKGDVISLSPADRALKGSTVTLTISAGPKMIQVPSVSGQSPSQAETTLKQAGLQVSSSPRKVASATIPVGSVVGTTPAGGTSWPVTRPVFVDVSAGIPMPPLTGQNISAVQGWASQNNIQLNIQQAPDSAAAGTIIKQSVPAGQPVSQGATVTVTVSQGPPQVQIPQVTGQPFQQAQQALQQAGFKVKGQQVGFNFGGGSFGGGGNGNGNGGGGQGGGKVIATSPSGQAPQGSTITVYYFPGG